MPGAPAAVRPCGFYGGPATGRLGPGPGRFAAAGEHVSGELIAARLAALEELPLILPARQ